ncbi:DUF3499 domain-containing protein [Actinobaculum suis]|uniref:DUF3499 family protein n=1 Tax=Actinobaculum suis TaxID=1657 RepID=A0AAW9HPQ2_9ACTO|nr:DUF3499 family protein [Actinobaculum suis]MDY5153504.1 DUF3499 family protein [Actinobaculum suis]
MRAVCVLGGRFVFYAGGLSLSGGRLVFGWQAVCVLGGRFVRGRAAPAVVPLLGVSHVRKCSRVGCENAAVATMTYGYADATAVIGPLSPKPTPGGLDLCARHAEAVTVPRGWQMIRLRTEFEPAPPSESDLMALADAIRETSQREAPAPEQADRRARRASDVPNWKTGYGNERRRPNLRVVPDAVSAPESASAPVAASTPEPGSGLRAGRAPYSASTAGSGNSATSAPSAPESARENTREKTRESVREITPEREPGSTPENAAERAPGIMEAWKKGRKGRK